MSGQGLNRFEISRGRGRSWGRAFRPPLSRGRTVPTVPTSRYSQTGNFRHNNYEPSYRDEVVQSSSPAPSPSSSVCSSASSSSKTGAKKKLSERFADYDKPESTRDDHMAANQHVKEMENAEMLVVSNFPFGTTEDEILHLFEDYEPLGVWFINNDYVRYGCTEAHVAIPNKELAFNAVMTLDNSTYRNRCLLVSPIEDGSMVDELRSVNRELRQ